MNVSDFAKKYSLNVHALPDPSREIKNCYIGDLLSWVMGRASENDCWLTIMSNANIIAVASLVNVSCVVLTEGVTPDDELIKLAKEKKINLLSSDKDSYNVAKMLANEI